MLKEGEIIIKKELCIEEGKREESEEKKEEDKEYIEEYTERDKFTRIYLKISPPPGKLSDIVRMVSYIKSKFNNVKIKIEIDAEEGEIDILDYENKIEEALKQAEVKIEEERKY